VILVLVMMKVMRWKEIGILSIYIRRSARSWPKSRVKNNAVQKEPNANINIDIRGSLILEFIPRFFDYNNYI
jgi:hypothetical protein